MKAQDIQRELVEKLVTALESGDVGTWRKPWVDSLATGWPTNVSTRKGYQGGNTIALIYGQVAGGFQRPLWATYKQWQELLAGTEHAEAPVIKGSKGTHLVKWAERRPCPGHPANASCDKCKGKPRLFPVGFVVFNAEQIHGGVEVAAKRFPIEEPDGQHVWEAEDHRDDIEAYITATGAVVKHEPGRAWYSPQLDWISVPTREDFESPRAFYATLLHELTHWTGHKSRCDRDQTGRFGSGDYAFEELVAELGSIFVGVGRFGLELPERDDHVAYLHNWAQALRAKPAILWTAAKAATTAFDHLEALQPQVEASEPASELVAA